MQMDFFFSIVRQTVGEIFGVILQLVSPLIL